MDKFVRVIEHRNRFRKGIQWALQEYCRKPSKSRKTSNSHYQAFDCCVYQNALVIL